MGRPLCFNLSSSDLDRMYQKFRSTANKKRPGLWLGENGCRLAKQTLFLSF